MLQKSCCLIASLCHWVSLYFRTMYFATPDTIYIANMDGTNVRVLIYLPGASFDGMVLDIRRDL